MARVALAGFFHETNTFSPIPADLAAFRRPGTLPGLTLGADMPRVLSGLPVPVAGAMRVLAAAGHALVPIAWASAVPCGAVTREAFETIAGLILDGLRRAAPDAVYLDLHGAMVAEGDPDPELTLLRRIRAALPGVPIAAGLDLHANLSAARVAALDALSLFRSYPHLDMAETGERAARLLLRRMRGAPIHAALRHLPFLVPLHAQGTTSGPAARLYAAAAEIERRPGLLGVELALGFPPADVPHAGPAVVTLAATQAEADAAAEELYALVLAAEADFEMPLPGPDEAVREALDSVRPGRPVVIADTQDNPGAGGGGDTVGLLRALIAADAPDAVVALLHAPEAARQAHALGEGATARFRLGGEIEMPFAVDRVTEGRITGIGPMYRGIPWEVGACAVLRHRGIRVLVAERRLQAADTAVLRHAGIDPAAHALVVLKSTVHFRAEYEALAARIIVAAAPGLNLADLRAYPYRQLRPGVRPVTPAGS